MNLDEVVRVLEKRPGMISLNHSITEAELFINGFLFSKSLNGGLDVNEVEFKDEFSNWIAATYGCNIQSSWGRVILFYEGAETTALNRFIKLYDDFFIRKR